MRCEINSSLVLSFPPAAQCIKIKFTKNALPKRGIKSHPLCIIMIQWKTWPFLFFNFRSVLPSDETFPRSLAAALPVGEAITRYSRAVTM